MATFNSLLTASTAPAPPTFSPGGNHQSLPSGQTIDTTTLAATDFQKLFPVTNGTLLNMLVLEVADPDTNATETLDMDVILRDDNGDTILFNAGAAFENAYDDTIQLLGVRVVAESNPEAFVGFYINTAAATGVAAASVSGTLFTRS